MIGIPRRWTGAASAKTPDNPVSLAEATRVWATIGWLSFGGPAGQIALMHRELVEQRRWISDARFLHALSYCMLLPGPEAQQLAIYIGWLMHRTGGACRKRLSDRSTDCPGRVNPYEAFPASVCRRARGLSCTVVRASGWLDAAFRPSQRVRPAGHVLRGSRAGHLRRRLCGARLCRATRRRDVRLAQPGRDARRSGACRDHAWPADHGGAVRGFPRGIPPSGRSVAVCRRCTRLAAHYLGNVHTVFLVDLPRRTLRRSPTQQPHTERGPLCDYGGCGGCDTQLVGLVRRAHGISQRADASHRLYACRCAGMAECRSRRIGAQHLRATGNAALQVGDGLDVIRQRSARCWHLDVFLRGVDIAAKLVGDPVSEGPALARRPGRLYARTAACPWHEGAPLSRARRTI